MVSELLDLAHFEMIHSGSTNDTRRPCLKPLRKLKLVSQILHTHTHMNMYVMHTSFNHEIF